MSLSNLAFVFPGQGSQKTGMLGDLAAAYPLVQDTFTEASGAIGIDLWEMAQHGEQETLNLTENTQPLLLAASVAVWRVWQQQGGAAPALMAGHSLGEFSALVCAGALPFADAVALVKKRGQAMQTAVPVGVGAMAAVLGLDDEAISKVCAEAAGDGVVEAVNFNSPGQVVIAGHKEAVERAIEACKAAGAKRAMPLPVSAPFHTSLMQPAGEVLAQALAEIDVAAPAIPVVHNVHAATETDPAAIKALLVRQIYSPVRWVDCVNAMTNAGTETVIECGPGKVLSGLCKRIHKPLTTLAMDDPAGIDAALAALA